MQLSPPRSHERQHIHAAWTCGPGQVQHLLKKSLLACMMLLEPLQFALKRLGSRPPWAVPVHCYDDSLQPCQLCCSCVNTGQLLAVGVELPVLGRRHCPCRQAEDGRDPESLRGALAECCLYSQLVQLTLHYDGLMRTLHKRQQQQPLAYLSSFNCGTTNH
jgi:hypothetical protein